jgi:ubiquinone/menaquinone biosynthesis C-methylase UbiE
MLDQYQSSETKMEYFGLDASPSMIQLASEHFSNYGHFIIGEAENIQFKSDIFNTVFSNSVLHWLNIEKDDSMEKALGEIFRVLIPGGVFAVSISGMVQFKNFRMLIVE